MKLSQKEIINLFRKAVYPTVIKNSPTFILNLIEQIGFEGNILIHHHLIGGDGQAVVLPQDLQVCRTNKNYKYPLDMVFRN